MIVSFNIGSSDNETAQHAEETLREVFLHQNFVFQDKSYLIVNDDCYVVVDGKCQSLRIEVQGSNVSFCLLLKLYLVKPTLDKNFDTW